MIRGLVAGAAMGLFSCGGGAAQHRAAPAEAPGGAVASPAVAADGTARREETPMTVTTGTFADDLAFLRKHGDVRVLRGASGAVLALSPKYQGRVMTTAVGEQERSLGWINRPFIEAGKTGTQFDNYGGEDRFWLGPEGGQFGLYFAPGAPFTFDAWQTPHALQEGAWEVVSEDEGRVTLKRSMTVTNWSKTTFHVDVERTIRMLGAADVATHLGMAPDATNGAALVAYASENAIQNAGKAPWTEAGGLLSIWILAMYAPVPDTRIVIPFVTGGDASGTPIVNDAYFGKIPDDRLEVREDKGVLFFRGDGEVRGKLGLGPARAKNVLGSYSARAKLLTVVQYDRVEAPRGKRLPYVNSMWERQKHPYAGDVVNSYNDGPPAPGKPKLGGFYEIETSSPAAALSPGATMHHVQRTFHFVGEPSALDPIAKKAFGVSLEEIGRALPSR